MKISRIVKARFLRLILGFLFDFRCECKGGNFSRITFQDGFEWVDTIAHRINLKRSKIYSVHWNYKKPRLPWAQIPHFSFLRWVLKSMFSSFLQHQPGVLSYKLENIWRGESHLSEIFHLLDSPTFSLGYPASHLQDETWNLSFHISGATTKARFQHAQFLQTDTKSSSSRAGLHIALFLHFAEMFPSSPPVDIVSAARVFQRKFIRQNWTTRISSALRLSGTRHSYSGPPEKRD